MSAALALVDKPSVFILSQTVECPCLFARHGETGGVEGQVALVSFDVSIVCQTYLFYLQICTFQCPIRPSWLFPNCGCLPDCKGGEQTQIKVCWHQIAFISVKSCKEELQGKGVENKKKNQRIVFCWGACGRISFGQTNKLWILMKTCRWCVRTNRILTSGER